MPPLNFPLRWESTGDQWWYASPIDFAAANGHYDLVKELLYLDTNLLIKLTSLRRIRRLETVWDDEEQFDDVAKCRSLVARKLLRDCERKRGHNSLIQAGYGGWLLYTAASAGDVGFVRELLEERDPLLVFGEGEYGVTDILYAAARSKNCEVFKLLLDNAVKLNESESVFKWEMMNRAVHAAARGGNLVILKELLGDCVDVLVYRDVQGSTVLHSASGRGQVEVVKDLLESYDIASSTDNRGNTALHVAAYKGHSNVAKVLIVTSPILISATNSHGDTFLHMAVAGFRTPGFRRVDRQVELMKQMVCGKILDIQDIINVVNNNRRTALHLAVAENIHCNLVELLMTVPSIDLNVRDGDGMTPLDLLKRHPKSASSEILIKELISAGGISNCQDNVARNAIVSHLKGQGIGVSPGSSFRIPDAEIFLYTGIGNASDASCDATSVEYSTCQSEQSDLESNISVDKKSNSINSAARRLKFLLQWPKTKERKDAASSELGDDDPWEASSIEGSPIPLRQKYMKSLSLPNNKRTFSIRSDLPSPSTKKKFTAGLMHGVIQASPHLEAVPVSPRSGSSLASPTTSMNNKQKSVDISRPSCSNQSPGGRTPKSTKQDSLNKKLLNQFLRFGAQGLSVEEDSMSYTRTGRRSYKQTSALVA
ncbi:hypothetical protein QYF36_021005 [Acer negundo]|nr:hypothetical protein QYF36_021005 [Acer negundo]